MFVVVNKHTHTYLRENHDPVGILVVYAPTDVDGASGYEPQRERCQRIPIHREILARLFYTPPTSFSRTGIWYNTDLIGESGLICETSESLIIGSNCVKYEVFFYWGVNLSKTSRYNTICRTSTETFNCPFWNAKNVMNECRIYI